MQRSGHKDERQQFESRLPEGHALFVPFDLYRVPRFRGPLAACCGMKIIIHAESLEVCTSLLFTLRKACVQRFGHCWVLDVGGMTLPAPYSGLNTKGFTWCECRERDYIRLSILGHGWRAGILLRQDWQLTFL